MQNSQFEDRLNQLESDLLMDPPRISAYSGLPCALFRYEPAAEWRSRQEMNKLATRLGNGGKKVELVSMAQFLWKAIDEAEGLDPVVELETQEGWTAAQQQVNVYLSDPEFSNLPKLIASHLAQLKGADLVFLWRAGALAPGMYYISKLLDELRDRLPMPVVLFYPGVLDEQGLSFMGLRDRETTANYRVKIY